MMEATGYYCVNLRPLFGIHIIVWVYIWVSESEE